MSRLVDCARDHAFLLPPDLRDWIPDDDLAHFVIEAVERVDMSAFKVNHYAARHCASGWMRPVGASNPRQLVAAPNI